jgi:ATP-dependent Clp protease protease subunit
MGLGEWLDAQLFERRIVTLTGPLDDGAATRAAGALTALDAGSAEPIELHLDSPDGALGATFLVIDTIGLLRAPLRVRCRGQVGGPAIGILAAAERRMARSHARFRLAQPTARFTGTPAELEARSREQQDLLWRLYALVGRRCHRPAEEVAEDMRRGRYLDAAEALAYGLLDEVV